jgi:hypothetical protein
MQIRNPRNPVLKISLLRRCSTILAKTSGRGEGHTMSAWSLEVTGRFDCKEVKDGDVVDRGAS